MKVNLKFSSSSLFNRSKKVGTGTDEGLSGSCDAAKDYQSAKRQQEKTRRVWWGGEDLVRITCMYSIGVSSPRSRLALYLVAGKEFGVRFNNWRFELLIVTDAIATVERIYQHLFYAENVDVVEAWRGGLKS